MSKLEDALSRFLWRYEKAKKYSKSDEGKNQIEEDSLLILNTYKSYQSIMVELFESSISGDVENPNFDDMNVDMIIIWANYHKWKHYGLDDFEAIDAAITDGCPLNYFEKLSLKKTTKCH